MFRQTLRTVAKVNRLQAVRSYAAEANSLKLSFSMPHDVRILSHMTAMCCPWFNFMHFDTPMLISNGRNWGVQLIKESIHHFLYFHAHSLRNRLLIDLQNPTESIRYWSLIYEDPEFCSFWGLTVIRTQFIPSVFSYINMRSQSWS